MSEELTQSIERASSRAEAAGAPAAASSWIIRKLDPRPEDLLLEDPRVSALWGLLEEGSGAQFVLERDGSQKMWRVLPTEIRLLFYHPKTSEPFRYSLTSLKPSQLEAWAVANEIRHLRAHTRQELARLIKEGWNDDPPESYG